MALNSAVTDTQWSPNYSAGRPAPPDHIVIHHWGADGQKHQDVVNYLCRKDGDSSAHYVASGGRVTQLVHDYDRAWHAGSSGNPRGIGIECRPEATREDFETVAHLIAAIREQWGDLPLVGHRDHMPTACPGRWYPMLTELSARADEINGHTPAPAPAPAPAPIEGIAVDGVWGEETTRALQKYLGTVIDGVIDGQHSPNQQFIPAVGTGWQWDGTGSPCVAALQRHLGVEADGIIGTNTIQALQQHLGVTQDGYMGAETVTALQQHLNEGNLF